MKESKEEYFIITIYYKSGNKVTIRCSEFNIKNGDYSWTPAQNKEYPHKPLQLGIENIESIFFKEE